MDGFTDEEWQEFIQKGLNNGALATPTRRCFK